MGGWAESLVTKARERGLERAAAAYAVAGWLLVQAASIALPAYQAPAWMLRWLIAATILGFPIAITTGWIAGRERPTAVRRFGWFDVALLTVIGTVVALTLGELAWHWSANPEAQDELSASLPSQTSIAVLPFVNTSGDANQRYFSEGLTDELIGLLARNSALRVAARTSSYFFEGKNEDVRNIAHKLNVRTVLEGSVRSANGRVRIEADLTNATDGYQLWSESYDRPATDILLVQADIASAIANALMPKLLGKAPVPKAHAIDPEAYRLFLQGQFDMGQRTLASEQTALTLFRQVAKREPDFAEGQAALAYDLDLVNFRTHDAKLNAERDAALKKAILLDPTNPNARTLSIELATRESRWDDVIDNALVLKRAHANSVDSLRGLAFAYDAFGLTQLTLAAWQEAVRLDPLSYNARSNLADTLTNLSRFQEAVDQIREGMKLSPANDFGLAMLCGALGLLGKTKEA